MYLEREQEHVVKIQFDPAYKEDFHIRTIDEVLTVAYREHPHVVSGAGIWIWNLDWDLELGISFFVAFSAILDIYR